MQLSAFSMSGEVLWPHSQGIAKIYQAKHLQKAAEGLLQDWGSNVTSLTRYIEDLPGKEPPARSREHGGCTRCMLAVFHYESMPSDAEYLQWLKNLWVFIPEQHNRTRQGLKHQQQVFWARLPPAFKSGMLSAGSLCHGDGNSGVLSTNG